MARYQLIYKRTAAKDIKNLSPEIKKRLKSKLEFFRDQPDPIIFAKRLTKPSDAQYRFRVGNYRILFDIVGSNIEILHVQHRKNVYKKYI